MDPNRILAIRLFLRYSSTGILAIIFLYIGIQQKVEGYSLLWTMMIVLGAVMAIWGIFRVYSAVTMNKLVGMVDVGDMSYEQLFSYDISKKRLLKTIFHTVLTAAFFIWVITLVVTYSEDAVGQLLLVMLMFAVFIMNFLRVKNSKGIAEKRERIERNRITAGL